MAESYMQNCNDVFNTYFEQQQIIKLTYKKIDTLKLKIHNSPKVLRRNLLTHLIYYTKRFII